MTLVAEKIIQNISKWFHYIMKRVESEEVIVVIEMSIEEKIDRWHIICR